MLNLPPIRRLIKPDPGYILVDVDLDRAEMQIVAWEADEHAMKAVFASGEDTHMANAKLVWGPNATMVQRQKAKNGGHATDYACKPITLASTLGCTVREAEEFQQQWFKRFPNILQWHRKVDQLIRFKREVRNIWGFRRFYFDRLDKVNMGQFTEILPQALAWICQSSVAVTINKARAKIDCARQLLNKPRCGECLLCRKPGSLIVLLQVHDSLLMQMPISLAPGIFNDIRDSMMDVVLPYEDPLVIPVSMTYSFKSYHKEDMVKWKPGDMELRDAA